MDIINGILKRIVFENTVLDYLIALGVFIGCFILIKIIGLIVVKKIKTWAKETATLIDDLLISILEKKIVPFLYL
ncbi:MAG: mechanosensitive ion channel family protein, partial [Candidatus Omnitrophica bacterium]|nr:mechanosensitive ion channel family protein [Candidatus Omnitrophota bacterium]